MNEWIFQFINRVAPYVEDGFAGADDSAHQRAAADTFARQRDSHHQIATRWQKNAKKCWKQKSFNSPTRSWKVLNECRLTSSSRSFIASAKSVSSIKCKYSSSPSCVQLINRYGTRWKIWFHMYITLLYLYYTYIIVPLLLLPTVI